MSVRLETHTGRIRDSQGSGWDDSHCSLGRGSVQAGENKGPTGPSHFFCGQSTWDDSGMAKFVSFTHAPHLSPPSAFLPENQVCLQEAELCLPTANILDLPDPWLPKLKNWSISSSPIFAFAKENQFLGLCQSHIFHWNPDSLTFKLKNLSLVSFFF